MCIRKHYLQAALFVEEEVKCKGGGACIRFLRRIPRLAYRTLRTRRARHDDARLARRLQRWSLRRHHLQKAALDQAWWLHVCSIKLAFPYFSSAFS